ncbi:Mpo1-like protein [Paracidovorax citrulli]
MPTKSPLARQWRDYAASHRHPLNLLIHLVAVPMFLAGTVLTVYGLARLSLPAIALGLVAAGMSLALQARGHRLEPQRPAPFDGPRDAAVRLLAEQWITFPRYLLSGNWWAALRRHRDAASSEFCPLARRD